MTQGNAILDGMGSTVRNIAYTIEYDLLDTGFNVIGSLNPISASSVTMNVSSAIMRSISGVGLTANQMASIDPFADRIRPKMVLGDGTEWPLGVFVFSDEKITVYDGISPVSLTLGDPSTLLSQPTLETISFPAGASIVNSVQTLVIKYGVRNYDIPIGDGTIVGPSGVTWAAGSNVWKAIQDLCALAGFLPAYFDNNGSLIIRKPVPSPDADFVFTSTGGRVVNQSLHTNKKLLTAPNAYQVIDTAPSAGPIAAIAYVDPQLPWSKENRGGYIIPSVTRKQGLNSVAQAQAMADALAAASGHGFSTIEFYSLPDPRHDLFSNVEWDGTIYRETQVTFGLAFGALQSHTIVEGGFTVAS